VNEVGAKSGPLFFEEFPNMITLAATLFVILVAIIFWPVTVFLAGCTVFFYAFMFLFF
jgi:hypothetical protein